MLSNRAGGGGERPDHTLKNQFDDIDLNIIQCSYQAAFQTLHGLLQPGRLSIRTVPEYRLHAAISHLVGHVSNPDDVKVLNLVCQHFARYSSGFTLLDSVNILNVIEKCLEFPSCTVITLEILLSLVNVLHPNISAIFDRIRRILFPLCQSCDDLIQRLAIDSLVEIIRTCQTKGSAKLIPDPEVTLMLSLIPGLIRRQSLRNLLSALQCLLLVIPLAPLSIQTSSTSVLLILRKCLLLQGSKCIPADARMESDSDNVSSLLITIRCTALSCIKKVAHLMPSLLNGFWSSFLPVSVADALDRFPFGGPTLVSLMLFDPSVKVRVLSSEALAAVIEGAPFRSEDLAKFLSTKGTSSFNPRIQETVDALHFACLHCLSNDRPEFAVLKVVSSLAARVSYTPLLLSQKYLSEIFSILVSCLQNCNIAVKQDLLKCLASIATAPVMHDITIIGSAIRILLEQYQRDRDRSPPNSLTVIGRISRRHSSVLSQYWHQICPELLGALQHRNENVRMSALTLIEEWLSTEGVLNTFLIFERGEEILQVIVQNAKTGTVNLTSKSLITLSKISRHSWTSEITESSRRQICSLMQHFCCNADFLGFPERLQGAIFRFTGAVASFCINDSIIQEVLPQVCKYGSQKYSGSISNRAAQALSDILDSLVIPSKAADVLVLESDSVSRCFNEYLSSRNIATVINAIRICSSVFQIEDFKDLARVAISKLLTLLNDHPSNAKIQWNVCRAFGSFISSEFFESPGVIEALLRCARSPNAKVARSAFNAMNHPPLFARHPSFAQQFTDLITRCSNSELSQCISKAAESQIIDGLRPGAEPVMTLLNDRTSSS